MEVPISIIITEDKKSWRVMMRQELAKHNINTIAEAENGLELFKLLEVHSPDVVILDLAMPVMDGNETMTYLNMTYPEQKVIIMSLFDDPTLMDDYVMRNIKGCISKTEAASDIDLLAAAIRKVHKGGKHFNFATEEQIMEFSIRQKEIINLYGKGKTQKEIATELGITTDAVEKQKNKIMTIMGVKNPSEMFARIFELGFQFFRSPKAK